MRSDDRGATTGGSTQGAHLSDDQLMEIHVLAADNLHLAACSLCMDRFDDFGRALEQIRDDAVREADSLFSAERLHDQRDRILRRLERQGHPADVVMFPTRSQHPPVRRILGPARRWVAGAAAAGLAAGLFLGFAVDRRVSSTAARRAVQSPVAAAVAWPAPAAPRWYDEQFLTEIEDDLMGPRRLLELRTLDAMTTPPDLQEASLDIR